MKVKLPVKTFSGYRLIDVKDFYLKCWQKMEELEIDYCFVEDKMITMEDCKKFFIAGEAEMFGIDNNPYHRKEEDIQ
jgi:hypothetical protein